jgi:uncharacterized protein YecT (DUF1311 family)
MTAHDPQLVLPGNLPWHFERRADDADDDDANYAADDEPNGAADYSFADAVADEEEGVNPLAIAVVAAALVVGIGVGAGGTALLMSWHHARPPPKAVASLTPPAPKPAPLAIARTAPPPVEAVTPAAPGELGATAIEPAPAAKSASPRAHRSAAQTAAAPARMATACDTSGGQRETLICASPAIAADDREMRRAYQRALDVGVERNSLKASQARWSVTSEFAAQRSAADLAAAYHRRIGELNALAANEPPH